MQAEQLAISSRWRRRRSVRCAHDDATHQGSVFTNSSSPPDGCCSGDKRCCQPLWPVRRATEVDRHGLMLRGQCACEAVSSTL
jgi:hypothetical protein